MTSLRWLTLPFRFTTTVNFYQQLNNWLSEVYYTTLPEAGFEIREEQIYSCFRMVNAFREKGALMAEAGSGTGKTFAYLLPSLCYARLTGKPVVISCSSSTLQEQIVSPKGDIFTLSDLLALDIKAVLAKDPGNYLCAVQAEMAKFSLPKHPQRSKLVRWLDKTKTGDRTELPEIDDSLWWEVAYHDALDCRHCRRRGYCHQAKARQELWEEQDFVICSHDVFFRDLWTRQGRMEKQVRLFQMEETKLPYLPHYSAVVIDEAHLVEGPALRNLGLRLNLDTIKGMAAIFHGLPLVTDKLLFALENLGKLSEAWFAQLKEGATAVTETQWLIEPKAAGDLSLKMAVSLEETMEEMAMYRQHDINQYIQDLENFAQGLSCLGKEYITWWDNSSQDLWILPRDFSQALGRELLAKKIPVLFTSATLNADDDFAYFKRLTGIAEAKSSKVTTSFALEEQMQIWLGGGEDKTQHCIDLVRANGGRALILCNTQAELEQLRAGLAKERFPFDLIWEGAGDSSWLVQKFREEKTSVLVGTSFWEGIDVPGDSLTLVIIYSLPFPIHTPMVLAQREQAQAQGRDPYLTVDLPSMGIKLRQGIGRLIRSKEDQGVVAVLGGGDRRLRRKVQAFLPPGVAVTPIYTPQVLAEVDIRK